jgi:hypothetical protein
MCRLSENWDLEISEKVTLWNRFLFCFFVFEKFVCLLAWIWQSIWECGMKQMSVDEEI